MTSKLGSRGSARGGAPARFGATLALGVSLALVASMSAAARAPRDPVRAPEAVTSLRFAGLAWDWGPQQVAAALASRGYRRVASRDEAAREWRGAAFGRAARVSPEFDSSSRLVAVTLRFETDPRGSAMQRYAELVEAMRSRHGAPTAQVEPGRPVVEERTGRWDITRRFGPRTAATMWTDAAGGAAAAQLDGEGVVWLRYESPRWEEAFEPVRNPRDPRGPRNPR